MKTQSMLKTVNPVLFVVVVVQLLTVVIQAISYMSWVGTVHQFAGYSFFILVIIHIIFNWAWIKNNFFKKKQN
jgi:high-affinity K+ transport system ATPase subunit B